MGDRGASSRDARLARTSDGSKYQRHQTSSLHSLAVKCRNIHAPYASIQCACSVCFHTYIDAHRKHIGAHLNTYCRHMANIFACTCMESQTYMHAHLAKHACMHSSHMPCQTCLHPHLNTCMYRHVNVHTHVANVL